MYDEDEDDSLGDCDEEDDEEGDEEEEEDGYKSSRSMDAASKRALRRQRAKLMKQYWANRRRLAGRAPGSQFSTRKLKPPSWKSHLEDLRRQSTEPQSSSPWPEGKETIYLLHLTDRYGPDKAAIEIHTREAKKSGGWRKSRSCAVYHEKLQEFPDPRDRRILQVLIGAPKHYSYSEPASRFYPSDKALAELLPLMCATGRCFIAAGDFQDEMHPCAWDEGEPWHLRVSMRRESSKYRLSGSLSRGEESIGLKEPEAISKNGIFSLRGRIAPFDDVGCFEWMRLLRREEHVDVPVRDRDLLLRELLQMPWLPELELPEELQFEEVRSPGRPVLRIRRSPNSWEREMLYADFGFEYAGFLVSAADRATAFAYRLIARDTVEEKVLELQNTKRDLAQAIITADNSLIRNLRPEDLALLLS